MNGSNHTSALVAGVVALVIGGVGGYAISESMDGMDKNNSNSSMSQMVETSASNDLRVGMNNLLREHVASSLDVTRAIADERPQAEIDGAVSAQTANAGEIAAAVGSVYGEEAQTQITEMFVEHIEASNDYARAVAANDDAAKEAANEELNEYLDEISAFFSGAIDDLPQDTVYGLLQEHEMLLNDSVQAYQDGDFTRSYELEREALTQVNGVADALSSGIVATNPDKFSE